MFILHLFVLLLQLLHGQRLTMALSGCVCTNPSSGLYGTWGNWTGLTPPICNGTCRQTWQTGLYTCKVTSLGGKLITTMNCSRTLYNKCDDPCPGQWGLWSPTAPCNVTCGSGKQEETRYCYKKNVTGNVRIAGCVGAPGITDQMRQRKCTRMKNCSLIPTTPSAKEARKTAPTVTTKVQGTTKLLTSTKPRHMTAPKTPKRATTTTTTTTDTIQIASPPTRGINTIAVAAVLGTIAIISVTVVALAAAFVFLRKKPPSSHIVSYATGNGTTSLLTPVTVVRRNNEKPDEHEPLPMIPYEFESAEDGSVRSGTTRSNLPNNNIDNAPEAVYSTVDDQHK